MEVLQRRRRRISQTFAAISSTWICSTIPLGLISSSSTVRKEANSSADPLFQGGAESSTSLPSDRRVILEVSNCSIRSNPKFDAVIRNAA